MPSRPGPKTFGTISPVKDPLTGQLNSCVSNLSASNP